MFKLIKYELRSTFLTMLGICTTVIIANLLLMTKRDSWQIAVPGLSACLIFGSIIVIFISSLKIMSKYLHEDSGYLLFTLPQSGMSIITSRLITALIQISIVTFVSVSMFYLNVPEEIPFNFFKNVNFSIIIYNIIGYIWFMFYFLTLVYFCMVIGKVALKGKKIGKIGSFIIFIIISLAIGWLSFKIVDLFPQTLNFSDFSITANHNLLNSGFSSEGGELHINIASAIFDIITFAGLFKTASYLIDKKLDL